MENINLKMKENTKSFGFETHSDQILKKIMKLLLDNKLCNVTLIAGVDGVQ